nr:LamG-like jellyroll fold domain-containing protein [Streptomyces sp. SID3212]
MEVGWGGLISDPSSITWTDISQRVHMPSLVDISRGAADEKAETQVATMTAVLDNEDGALTPGNATSVWYPFVRRNTPVRFAVTTTTARTGAAPWPLVQLADDFDNGSVDAALWPNSYGGAVEVGGRARIPLTPGVPAAYQSARSWVLTGSQFSIKIAALPAVNGSSAASASVMVTGTTAGTRVGFTYSPVAATLRLVSEVGYFDAGATELTGSGLGNLWLRIREDSGSLYWETSDDGYTWTVRRTLATPAWVTAQQVAVELVATRTGGAPDYVEYDLANHRVHSRFWGVLNDLPVRWAGLESKVYISASDQLKPINKLPVLKSCLAEEIRTSDTLTGIYSFLSAYYPLTEPSGAFSAGDLSGRGAAAIAQTQVSTGGTLDFGTDGLAAGGDTSVTFTPASTSAGKYLTGDLGGGFQSDSNVTDEHTSLTPVVEFWFKSTTVSRAILGLYEPGLDHQIVFALNASGVLTIESTETGDALSVVTTGSGVLTNGQWHHVVHDNSNKTVWIDGFQVGGTLSIPTMINHRILHVGGYRGARLFSGQIAHVAIHHGTGPAALVYSDHWTAGTTAFGGEPADERIERLARYAGVDSVTIFGTTHDAIAAQGEGGTGALARMREVETTESGRLYAERDYFGLAYQSRDVRYNPDPSGEVFVIDHADLDTNDLELTDDDQKLINSVEASSPGGATQRVTAPESIAAFGEYPQQLTLLKVTDNSVLDAAYWTISRYADPLPELREVPIQAYTLPFYADILDADISSYFTVYNLPPQTAPEARVVVEGYTEKIGEQSHLITFRTSAAARDSVWVLEDPVYGVLDQTTRLAY